MAFSTKIRKARFVTNGYAAQSMAQAGSGLITRGIVPRIQSGQTVSDTPAPPLAPDKVFTRTLKDGTTRTKTYRGYAFRKAKKHPPAIRNLTYTGRTMRSIKVLTAAQNRAVIGATDSETNMKLAINNRRSRQFGVSPSDQLVLKAEFAKLPRHTVAVQVP